MRKNFTCYFYLLICFLTITIQAQTWNTQMVNPGIISGTQQITYSDENLPVIIYKVGYRDLMLSIWDGNSWYSKNIFHVSTYDILSSFIVRIDTTFIVGILNDRLYILELNRQGNILFQKQQLGISNTTLFVAEKAVSNKIYIAYTSNILFYITYDLISHSFGDIVTVDGSLNLLNPSIAIGPNNKIWLSYYDNNGRNLKVAKSDLNSNWDIYFVDTGGDVGQYSQIWVDNSNVAHVAYYDATNKKLKYATFNP